MIRDERMHAKLTALLSTAYKFVPDVIVLDDDGPDTFAAAFEKASLAHHKYHYIDGWSIYHDNKYQKVVDDEEIEVYMRNFMKKCLVKKYKEKTNKDGEKYMAATESPPCNRMKTPGYITSSLKWLRSMPEVKLMPSQKAPCVINPCEIAGKHIIAVQNGLLDVTDPAKPVLRDFTEDFYTFNYLPVNYDPDAKAPKWLWALGQSFQDDTGEPDGLVPDIIHRWIWDFMISDTSYQKIRALIGRRRSGKGVISRTICKLIGYQNVASTSISSLSSPHGLHPLLHKQLAFISDASITGKNVDNNRAVEILKGISGEDPQQINPKNKDMISVEKLPLNIFMVANEVQDLRDPSGALAGRFTFLETTQSFYGREDKTLESQMAAEMSGILNLVLACPKGDRIEHPNSDIMKQEFAELSSPYMAFINEQCDVDNPEKFVPCDVLWQFYCRWAEANKHHPPSKQKFKLAFNGAHDNVKRYRPVLSDAEVMAVKEDYGTDLKISKRPQCYKGIDVKETVKDANKYYSGSEPEIY